MSNWKKITSAILAFTMLTAVSACGKQAEPERTMPEETTEVTTSAEETETTTEEAETTEDTTASETTEDASGEGTTTETAAASGETTEAATEGAAAAVETQAAAQNNDQPAPAQTPAAQQGNNDHPAQTADPAPAQNTNAPEMEFTSGGVTVNVGESAQAFVSGVGYNNFESSPSCLGNGEDVVYYYNDYTLYVWDVDGSCQLVGIDLLNGNASTSRGITVGSSAQDVIAAYGNGYTEENSDFVYRYDNNCSLRFTLNDGKVTFISYNQDN